MKKLIIIFVPVLIIILGIFIYFNSFTVWIPDCENAEMVFVYGDENIHTKISEEDTEVIKSSLDSRSNLSLGEPFVFPACGFDENVYFSLGNSVFYPACDRCPVIKYKGKYFDISEKDMNKIRKIMEKYGAYFPCV